MNKLLRMVTLSLFTSISVLLSGCVQFSNQNTPAVAAEKKQKTIDRRVLTKNPHDSYSR